MRRGELYRKAEAHVEVGKILSDRECCHMDICEGVT